MIDGIATIGDAAALRALEATLRALPADATGAALRQVAVAGAATAPRADALALVVGLAKDRDPGVRLAVLRALATVEEDAPSAWHAADPDGIDRVIAAALATDTWPDVRRRAATSLGLRCQRPGPRAALVDAVVTVKEDPEVRRDALIALVHCRAQGAADLLAKIWDDGNAPIELRTQAVSLAITLGDATLGKTLVGRFRVWNAHSMQNEAALALAQAAAPAIALLAAPGAVEALIEALDNEAFPEIVSAAATALGQLGPTCPARAKAKLEAIGKSESQAARPASLAASRCGAKAR